jgi:hypothetical protein
MCARHGAVGCGTLYFTFRAPGCPAKTHPSFCEHIAVLRQWTGHAAPDEWRTALILSSARTASDTAVSSHTGWAFRPYGPSWPAIRALTEALCSSRGPLRKHPPSARRSAERWTGRAPAAVPHQETAKPSVFAPAHSSHFLVRCMRAWRCLLCRRRLEEPLPRHSCRGCRLHLCCRSHASRPPFPELRSWRSTPAFGSFR